MPLLHPGAQSAILARELWDVATGRARPFKLKTKLALMAICRRWMGRIEVDELFQVARSLRGRFTVDAFRDELRRIGSRRRRLTPDEIANRALRRKIKAAVKEAIELNMCPNCAGPLPCRDCEEIAARIADEQPRSE